jgi:D-alanyl-D-alanine endopeptidase (penicillin-binding protein 7)
MYLNRLRLMALVGLTSFGQAASFQVGAANNDTKAAKNSKSSTSATAKADAKKVAKSSKKPKVVRTTVTRSTQSTVAARPSFATALGLRGQNDDLSLKSSVAMVVNQDTKEVYFEKNPSVSLPIASITKLMTAMVVLDSKLPLDETLVINSDDVGIYRTSRLANGTVLTREEALLLALMSSENRAAYTLGRNYPGGIPAFIDAMNRKAKEIGMTHSHFADPTGLMSENVASAEDLTRMLGAAYQYKMIRDFSTWPDLTMMIGKRPQKFLNTNRLVRAGDMNIGLQKTGFINAAGKCLVMQARVNDTPLLLVFLDSVGTQSRFADAVRVRDWYERMPSGEPHAIRRLM